jgi:hypothetical protein
MKYKVGDIIKSNSTGKEWEILEYRDSDLTYKVKSLRTGNVFESISAFDIEQYFVGSPVEQTWHEHNFKKYEGFTEIYKYCDCGEKDYGTT